jgi:hypothetical protein
MMQMGDEDAPGTGDDGQWRQGDDLEQLGSDRR